MRISDWSSDVCSSDLLRVIAGLEAPGAGSVAIGGAAVDPPDRRAHQPALDRTSVVWGKSVSVREDLGGRRIIKKKTRITPTNIVRIYSMNGSRPYDQ